MKAPKPRPNEKLATIYAIKCGKSKNVKLIIYQFSEIFNIYFIPYLSTNLSTFTIKIPINKATAKAQLASIFLNSK